MDNGPYRLVGRIQHYAWGGRKFIPELLGFRPEPQTPYAEYWLGAHKKAPATVILEDDIRVHLDELIAEYPQRVLGHRIASKHGNLPYLFKVLDVEEPLSIQVHPTKPEAEVGFARENELGIPLDSPKRNYRDDNHKSELMVALSEFWLLHGFLPEAQLIRILRTVPEFQGLLRVFQDGGTAGLYGYVMTLPSDQVGAILRPLVARVRRKGEVVGWDKTSPEYWVARAVTDSKAGPMDRGLFSLYFLNLVNLKPAQGIFQAAGVPHAYLRGRNIEVMANSDNVLRGGLTGKHVDVPELLRTVNFEGVSPTVIEGNCLDKPAEVKYKVPTDAFSLSRIELAKGESYQGLAKSAEIVLIVAGAATADSDRRRLSLTRGQSAVAFSGADYRLTADAEETVLYRVSLP